jgi:Uma2 family endonuclease
MVAKRDGWISLEDFLALDLESLDQRYEYIDGHMQAMAGGTNMHAILISNASYLLQSHLEGSACIVFPSDMWVRIEDAVLSPDISVSCEPRDIGETAKTITSPCLVIEVLSPTTEIDDRGRKFYIYQQCLSLKEYVLIRQDSMLVEIFTRKGRLWEYCAYRKGDTIELKSFGLTFPIERLYRNVILSP